MAMKVFDEITERYIILRGALIEGFAHKRLYRESIKRTVEKMQQTGIKPDIVTIATTIPVCAKMKASKTGKEMHAFANGSSCDALSVFQSMLQIKQRPDGVALARILSICGEMGSIKFGTEFHAQVFKMKLESVPIVMAEVVKMKGKFTNVGNARMAYDGIDNEGSLTCRTIIEACGFNSQYEEAIHIVDSMLSNGLVPNHYMFDVVLRICERSDFVDLALRIFNMMIQEHDIKGL
ncbi:hypothetical protein ZIOFF_008928 [Zingiber officinale]|uniref:Pentatricopeptide repeat-containing protein n=1 Tax=Zingiber officinale TaxID=94328 RepID=A0A8J5I7F4_ZINOF|nr:hypothetical protein ZIOFF_008928 [Zingiber officinale]